jgi:hypothetical protein
MDSLDQIGETVIESLAAYFGEAQMPPWQVAGLPVGSGGHFRKPVA